MGDTMNNIEFRYYYRDGANFKKLGSVVFSNPEQLDPRVIDTTLRGSFWDDLFIAHQARVPEVFLYLDGPFSFDDHCYHEFVAVEASDRPSNDEHGRTVAEFASEVAGLRGRWQEFDPNDSHSWAGRTLAA
jgi:hypothetical protein